MQCNHQLNAPNENSAIRGILPPDGGVWPDSLMLFIYCTFKLTMVLACACGVTALLVAVTVIE
jgi:hypothetical protein